MCYSFVSKSTDRELVEQYRQEAHSRNYTLQLVALRNWSTYSAYAGTVHFLFSLYCNLFVLNESKCNFVHGYLQKCVVVLSTTNRDDRHLVKLFSWSFRLHAAFVAGVLIALLILNALNGNRTRDFFGGFCTVLYDVNVVASEYLLVFLFYIGSQTLKEIELRLQNLLVRLGNYYQHQFLYRRQKEITPFIHSEINCRRRRRTGRYFSLPYMELKVLRQRHNICLDEMEKLRHIYRWYMLMIVAINVTHLFYAFYHTTFFAYLVLFKKEPLCSMMVATIMICLYHTFRLWLFCVCGGIINDRIKSLDIVLDRLLLCRPASDLIFFKIKLFQFQNHVRKFNMSVFDLFNLDSSFFHSVLGGILAYVVVLVQLSTTDVVNKASLIFNTTKPTSDFRYI